MCALSLRVSAKSNKECLEEEKLHTRHALALLFSLGSFKKIPPMPSSLRRKITQKLGPFAAGLEKRKQTYMENI